MWNRSCNAPTTQGFLLTHLRIPRPPVAPVAIAGILLAARRFLDDYELPHPSAAAVLSATGAGKTRAYEVAEQILDLLPGLVRPPGRPAAPPAAPTVPSDAEAIAREVIEYVFAQPGCVTGKARRRYSDGFRQFIVELRERFASVDAPAFAAAVAVPEATLADWLRATADSDPPAIDPDPLVTEPTGDTPDATHPRIQMILAAWDTWDGPFTTFCDHIVDELHIPYGRTFIGSVLAHHGVRIPRRRSGRSPDELALRNAFVTFFPGAQWVGDGMQVPVAINDEPFTFNLELDVDAYTGALVGAHVGDEEDSDAVIGAFVDGVRTTGAPPLALLLDNRESNHTDPVDAALGDDTIKIRATLSRPQNKAHVEGAFGLFAQTAPPLTIAARTIKQLAAQALVLAVTTWARTLNHKPRSDRDGRSRVAIYREDQPTADQIETAKQALEARRQQQEKAYDTQRARNDPIVRAVLDREFDRLDLVDPDGNTKRAIARYPLDAILPGIAIFEGKRDAHTLPDGAGARYLLGIVSNVSHRREDRAMTDALIRLRLAARDTALAPLDSICRQILRDFSTPTDCIKQLLRRALDAEREIDHRFWLHAVADVVADQPAAEQIDRFRSAAARIRSAYRVPHHRRQHAILFLAEQCPALQCS